MLDNFCVFCGKPIEDGKLTCAECAVFIKDLTPDQKRVLAKIQADHDSRTALIESVRIQITEILDFVITAIRKIVDVIESMLSQEEKEDG